MAKSPERAAFRNAKDRCTNPNHRRYPDYGGRGITFHEAWMGEDGFDQFFAEVGPRPTDQHSLGRIDNNKGYEPKNLAWQTKQEQAKATRQPRRRRLDFGHGYKLNSPLIPYNDEVKSMAEWARELGIKPATIYDRLIAGMSIADSLNPIPMKLR